MILSHQSDKVAEGIQHFTELSNEAVAILDKLKSNLGRITKLTGPLHDRATSLTYAEQNLASTKEAVDELLKAIDKIHKVESALRRGPHHDLDAYLAHLAQLDASLDFLQMHSTLRAAQEAHTHAEQVHSKAMEDCQSMFEKTLAYHSTALMPSASLLTSLAMESLQVATAKSQLEGFPPHAMDQLQKLAKVMLQSSHMSCVDVYTSIRARSLESAMHLMGLETRSAGSLKLQSADQLEKTMKSWTLQLRVLTVLAAHEMELARALWPKALSESVFGSVLPRMLELIIQIGHSISSTREQVQKLFVLLEMNQHLQEVVPVLEALQGKKSGGRGRFAQDISDLKRLQSTLGSSARNIFLEFEGSVGRDASKVQVVDGTVHPLCAQTVSYLRRLFTYPDVDQLIFSPPKAATSEVTAAAIAAAGLDQGIGASHHTSPGDAATIQMQEAVGRVMSALLANLEGRAMSYKDPALAALFLMNNVHYMVWAVEQSDRLSFLGESWIEAHKDTVERYGAEYHELTWMPMVTALEAVNRKEDREPENQDKWCEWVKAKFRDFNHALETIYAEQTGWTIPDPKLLSAVRRVILSDLLPPYDKFFRHFSILDFSTNRGKYARYSPKDVRSMIENDLLEGRKMKLSKVTKTVQHKSISKIGV